MTAETTPTTGDTTGPSGGYAAARLHLLTRGEQTGPPRRAQLARLTDAWLADLLDSGPRPARPARVALVAVGGYGRGELSPRSDLDLLLLHDGGAPRAEIAAVADRLWYPVWDLGIALDHSVRSLAEAHETAADDLKVHLGLLDARHLAGDAALTAELRTGLLARWRSRAATRLPELRALGQERAERHGELPFLLEPDLKEARGGLRDATALRAVAASWVADAPRQGLDAARNVLLDVRDALHLVTGRATDRLALEDQDQVARALGLLDADTLLRRVYEAARTISYASDVTWREVGRVLRARSARRGLRGLIGGSRGIRRAPAEERAPLADGVVEQEGEVVLARSARPDRDPVLPLRAAAAAAQHGLPLALPAVHAMAAADVRLPVPWPAEAREQFITLLGAGPDTVPVWEALEAAGLVTRLLPDWERVRCRPQRNAVHRWTVDRHLVETAVRASALTRRVGRPDLLLVAALLHDIGKGWPGDHSVAGETIARDMAARIGFGPTDVDVLATLVRQHLLLIETATRRDLDDPATVAQVSEAVGGAGTLELLHALTEADALATGPAAWSSWRASLLADLVKRVAARLGDGAEPVRPAPRGRSAATAERLALDALRTGAPVVTLRPGPGEGAADEDADAADASDEPRPVGVELFVAIPERPGVLPAVAGVLALHRLTVRSAELRTADPAGQGPVLLLQWRVAAEYGSLPQAERLRADLVRALEGSLDIATRLAEREAAYRRPRRRLNAPPPRVTVAAGGSRRATVIEVRAQDAPGLLHRIGRALDAAGVHVRSAHVSTLGANAVDAFYVTGTDDAPLPPEEAAGLVRDIEAALAPGAPPAPATAG
ncbi:[protein-PII] uridylyltransferase [Streptomyces radicis]|uniref:Bifunctional uridylyltransferase/uridylyl-removing enzyme n=1 Tax=Streptomyces radicis TaxID=1750517 RepID=A0A3A9W1L1_9ACTN|nr:[protein-PII] uridylyltransferase [Streptomyces radicis]RKN06652.1 [protein-PII] uridylyltransferase [Streptomyces radicis]RKN19277.1 [protein-PII] uridylyltransferase [Streptomyces radicis]